MSFMEIDNSPFTTTIFQNIWKKHFIPKKNLSVFKFIDGVTFFKSNYIPLFFNVGKNLTKGNYYTLKNAKDYKGKVFIIYDVPNHTKMEKSNEIAKNLEIYKSTQYQGYIIELNKFADMESYLLATFGKNTRMKFRKFTKRLDSCFDISTNMFYGSIDKIEYDALFEDFFNLLQKRYSDKKITYNNILRSEWEFYKEVVYPLILEKKASLFVLYDNNVPITITFSYHTKDTVIDAITVFDIDYAKFNVGYVNNLKLLDWCFDNHIKVFDFSKGYFDYKKRMSSLEYDFEYHILYDNNSWKARILALLCFKYYEFKLYLRKKHLNTKFYKLTYLMFNPINKVIKTEITNYTRIPTNELIKIDHEKESHSFLKKSINDFLYAINKHKREINVYKFKNEKDTFLIACNDTVNKVTFKS